MPVDTEFIYHEPSKVTFDLTLVKDAEIQALLEDNGYFTSDHWSQEATSGDELGDCLEGRTYGYHTPPFQTALNRLALCASEPCVFYFLWRKKYPLKIEFKEGIGTLSVAKDEGALTRLGNCVQDVSKQAYARFKQRLLKRMEKAKQIYVDSSSSSEEEEEDQKEEGEKTDMAHKLIHLADGTEAVVFVKTYKREAGSLPWEKVFCT
jgi:hypothetical protein